MVCNLLEVGAQGGGQVPVQEQRRHQLQPTDRVEQIVEKDLLQIVAAFLGADVADEDQGEERLADRQGTGCHAEVEGEGFPGMEHGDPRLSRHPLQGRLTLQDREDRTAIATARGIAATAAGLGMDAAHEFPGSGAQRLFDPGDAELLQ